MITRKTVYTVHGVSFDNKEDAHQFQVKEAAKEKLHSALKDRLQGKTISHYTTILNAILEESLEIKDILIGYNRKSGKKSKSPDNKV